MNVHQKHEMKGQGRARQVSVTERERMENTDFFKETFRRGGGLNSKMGKNRLGEVAKEASHDLPL